jgi:hypothetical protein
MATAEIVAVDRFAVSEQVSLDAHGRIIDRTIRRPRTTGAQIDDRVRLLTPQALDAARAPLWGQTLSTTMRRE